MEQKHLEVQGQHFHSQAGLALGFLTVEGSMVPVSSPCPWIPILLEGRALAVPPLPRYPQGNL